MMPVSCEFLICIMEIFYCTFYLGDHVAVYPQNDSALVDKIGDLVGVSLDTVVTLTNVDEDSSKKHPFPCPCSYRTAFTFYLDITSNPRTHVLKELADYTSDEEEK